jgi:hypothetical protein
VSVATDSAIDPPHMRCSCQARFRQSDKAEAAFNVAK